MSPVSVLSIGFTRGLWDGESAEDVRRMRGYAEELRDYVVVTNSYKQHRLSSLRLAPNFEAVPTNAYTPFDGFVRMLALGWKLLRTRQFSLIQAQDPFYCGLAATILGKVFRLPVIVCVYGPNVYDAHWIASNRMHRLLAPIGRWVLRRCRCIQVDGTMTARSLIAAGCPSSRVEVKPMVPANIAHFLGIPRTAASHAVVRLLFVGRLCSQKNLPLLLEIVDMLRQRTKTRFELVLVGEGSAEPQLQAIVKRDSLGSCVTFRGSVPREEIAAEFAAADIFVLTSDYEGYPRVLMEAAAAALPVVTTAVSGSDEAIENGESGYIVPIRAAEAFVEKLRLLVDDPAARIAFGAAARQRITDRLDPSTNTPAQIAIWKKVAQPGAGAASREPAATRRLLLFNLVTDKNDPILGFTTQWIRHLAKRVESIDVITMRAGEIDVPENVRVHSAGKELGYSEPRRVVEFYRHLFRILRSGRIDGCFSHMMPEFSVLAGPVLRGCGIPLVTWYAHPSLTLPVKLAYWLSSRVVTSLQRAYPYRREKLSVIGQGVDTNLFAPVPGVSASDGLILCVGRISRVKNHATLLRALSLLPSDVCLVILGATAGRADEEYARELRGIVAELGLGNRVRFGKPVAPTELPDQYSRCALHVNLTPAGFGDKVAWEAMSCGRPSVVANEDFRETLGPHADALLFRVGDAADLACKLDALLAMGPSERTALGASLRRQVERLHSLPQLAERILMELGSSVRGRAADFSSPQSGTPVAQI